MSGTSQAEQSKKRLRLLLSLDGGGVRGLSSIMMLGIFMTHINRGRQSKKDPWEVFDLIGGTSTGGLLAVMLGRLRMSVKDCERSYAQLSEAIFTPRRNRADLINRGLDFLKANGRFDESPLETNVKAKIVAAGIDEDACLEDYRPDACKIFVCATQVADNSPTLLRSYENPRVFGDLVEVKIWEAARATSAATTFFDPIRIGDHGELFADGALHHNNPIHQVYQEARDLWPEDDYLLLSIGTGSAPGQSLDEGLKSVVEQLAKIATETEQTARLFHRSHQDMASSNRLFRFNVYHGLGSIGLDESKELNQIASRTRTYLGEPEVVEKARSCVQAIRNATEAKQPQDESRTRSVLARVEIEKKAQSSVQAIRKATETREPAKDSTTFKVTVTEVSRKKLFDSPTTTPGTFSPDRKLIALRCPDQTEIRCLANEEVLCFICPRPEPGVRAVAFSPNNRLIAEADDANANINLWDVDRKTITQTLKHPESFIAVVFSPDGKVLAAGSNDGTLTLWDVPTGKVLAEVGAHRGSIFSVAISPDGKQVASSSLDNTVRLWDIGTGALLTTFEGHSSWVKSVVFSPDRKWIASGSLDQTIRLWDAVTGVHQRTLKGTLGLVECVEFSPDGKMLASVGRDGALRLWDVDSGILLETIENQYPYSLAFLPNGELLSVDKKDGALVYWRIDVTAN